MCRMLQGDIFRPDYILQSTPNNENKVYIRKTQKEKIHKKKQQSRCKSSFLEKIPYHSFMW